VLCECVAVLAVHSHCLEEKETEKAACHEEHYVAHHCAK
jgi:hypothetical protein